jgi:hypothetical protein
MGFIYASINEWNRYLLGISHLSVFQSFFFVLGYNSEKNRQKCLLPRVHILSAMARGFGKQPTNNDQQINLYINCKWIKRYVLWKTGNGHQGLECWEAHRSNPVCSIILMMQDQPYWKFTIWAESEGQSTGVSISGRRTIIIYWIWNTY